MRILVVLMVTVKITLAEPVISEIEPNPPGGSASIPGDLSHEYVEIYNPGPETLDLCRYYIKTSSSTSSLEPDSNGILPWSPDSLGEISNGAFVHYDSLLPPKAFALLLGRKYGSAPASSWYVPGEGSYLFATRKTYLRSSGLANASTVMRLFRSDGVQVSSFNDLEREALDPGESQTWQRVHPDSSDLPGNWQLALPTPGWSGFAGQIREEGASFAIALSARVLHPGCGDSLAFLTMEVRGAGAGELLLRVYDLKGRSIRLLCKGPLPGRLLQWDGRDDRGQRPGSGVYVLFAAYSENGRTQQWKSAIVVGGRCNAP